MTQEVIFMTQTILNSVHTAALTDLYT